MTMHTTFTTKVVDRDCPKGKNEDNCPLREWLNNNQKVFEVAGEELVIAEPLFRLARTPYVLAIEQMNQICRHCSEKTR